MAFTLVTARRDVKYSQAVLKTENALLLKSERCARDWGRYCLPAFGRRLQPLAPLHSQHVERQRTEPQRTQELHGFLTLLHLPARVQ
jgi:hypothetical protein